MAEIRPFRGLRYDERIAGALADLVTPPYDVIDATAQQGYYLRSPHNIIRLELGEQLSDDSPTSNRYSRAASYLSDWLTAGVLKREAEPALYVYQQTFEHEGRRLTRTGLLAMLRLEEWDRGVILPHEITMSGPKLDRLQLMRTTASNFSPIFTLYDDRNRLAKAALLEATSSAPAASFADESGKHQLWVVTNRQNVRAIAQVVRAGPMYIADGHHRYETALHYRNERRCMNGHCSGDEPWNFVMTLMVAVDDPGLLVLPTHRLVNSRAPRDGLWAALGEHFAIEQLRTTKLRELKDELERRGRERHVFGVYGLHPGTFHVLETLNAAAIAHRMPSNRTAAWRSLDVAVLHEVVIRRVLELSVADWSEEGWVSYTRDDIAARQAVDEGRYQLALFLNATPVRQVIAVADAHEVMPQKSTYFHPKPVTGLVLAPLDSD